MTGHLLVGVAETASLDEPRRYLVDLVRELRSLDVSTQVAAFADGPVLDALDPFAEVHLVEPRRRRSIAALVEGRAHEVSSRAARALGALRTRTPLRRPDCIHLHGATAAPLLHLVPWPDVPVTLYSHPLDLSVAALDLHDRRELLERTTRFLVASPLAAGPLRIAGVDEHLIVDAPARVPAAPPLPPSAADHRRSRGRVGLPDDRPLMAVLPSPGWSELPDLTLALVWEVHRRIGPGVAATIWYGVPGADDVDRRWPVDHEVDHMGLGDLILSDAVADWEDLLETADVILLPSGSSAFLPGDFAEAAASAATPVLCWADHPRADEVARWNGTVAQRGDVAALAEPIATALATEVGLRHARSAVWRAANAALDQIAPVPVLVP